MANGFRVDIVMSAEFLEKMEKYLTEEAKAQEEQASAANKEYDDVEDAIAYGIKLYDKKQIARKDKLEK